MITMLRVLAVDDETGMLSGVQRALDSYAIHVPEVDEQVTFTVDTEASGDVAVDRIHDSAPDILLLDARLHGTNGLEVLSKVSDCAEDMLTIVITTQASIETAVAATKQGAFDFLPKPFTPADLRNSLRKAATRILLTRRARELEAANRRARFEFIRVLGHELKAPIGAVAGYLYLLRDKALGEDVNAYGDMVQRSLRRLDQMQKLIVDLLDMTRLESGEKRRQIEAIDLVDAARQSIELMEPQASPRGITIALEAPDVLVHNRADAGEFDMMFNNLISNAVKYNRDGGHVTVRLSQDRDEFVIDVTDTGIGMSENEVAQLFEEFVRIRNAHTRDVLGSGLGLSILKRLAELYEGSVSVASEPDVGSTFTLRLKQAAAEAQEETAT